MSTTAKARVVFIAVLLLGLMAGGGFYWFSYGQYVVSTDNAYVEAEMAVITAKVSGLAQSVEVGENEVVEAGQPLVRIDDRDYRARVEQAAADVAARNAALATLDSEIELQESVINTTQAQLAEARAESLSAESDRRRFAELRRSGAVSSQQLEQAVARADQASAAVIAAQARIATEQKRIAVYKDHKTEALAGLQAAEAGLELARIALDDTVLKAPMNGVVGNKHVQVGQLLQPGVQVLTIVPLDKVYVTANFKETQIHSMRVGQAVTLRVDAFDDHELTGVVASFSPAAGSRFSLLPPENATGNFTKIVQRIPVRIELTNLEALPTSLRPGMSVEAIINTNADPVRPAVSRIEHE